MGEDRFLYGPHRHYLIPYHRFPLHLHNRLFRDVVLRCIRKITEKRDTSQERCSSLRCVLFFIFLTRTNAGSFRAARFSHSPGGNVPAVAANGPFTACCTCTLPMPCATTHYWCSPFHTSGYSSGPKPSAPDGPVSTCAYTSRYMSGATSSQSFYGAWHATVSRTSK